MSRVSTNREAAKARVRAKVEAEKTLTPREQLMNMLHAVRTHADSVVLLDAFAADVEREVRWQIARDFEKYGKRHDSLSTGEAYYIARDGLCSCRGGSKPCDAADIRELVEGGESR
ncbi:hypothetical protein [Streptomyces sp. NPDC059176]|uniref:hypothetical protein n=1 Tax=Streptomyces sp. NPDC059176 TaxID=3346758 RepID=UPI00369B9AC8